MGKWLDKFKQGTDSLDIINTMSILSVPITDISVDKLVKEQSESLMSRTDSLDTLSTMSILSVYESKEITKKDLREFLGEDWNDYKDNPQALKLWAEALHNSRLMEQGIAPPSFDGVTNCVHCGLVPVPKAIANGGHVLGCGWCFNRTKGLPIPQPTLDLINKISTR